MPKSSEYILCNICVRFPSFKPAKTTVSILIFSQLIQQASLIVLQLIYFKQNCNSTTLFCFIFCFYHPWCFFQKYGFQLFVLFQFAPQSIWSFHFPLIKYFLDLRKLTNNVS